MRKEQVVRRDRWEQVVLTIAMLCITGLFAGAQVWRLPGAAPTLASVRQSQDELDDVQLTIRDTGIEPSEITRGVGKFLLTADDRRSDKAQRLTLRLSEENGERVRDIEVPKNGIDWAEEVDLQAGRYVLSVVNHPEWSCRIIIE